MDPTRSTNATVSWRRSARAAAAEPDDVSALPRAAPHREQNRASSKTGASQLGQFTSLDPMERTGERGSRLRYPWLVLEGSRRESSVRYPRHGGALRLQPLSLLARRTDCPHCSIGPAASIRAHEGGMLLQGERESYRLAAGSPSRPHYDWKLTDSASPHWIYCSHLRCVAVSPSSSQSQFAALSLHPFVAMPCHLLSENLRQALERTAHTSMSHPLVNFNGTGQVDAIGLQEHSKCRGDQRRLLGL